MSAHEKWICLLDAVVVAVCIMLYPHDILHELNLVYELIANNGERDFSDQEMNPLLADLSRICDPDKRWESLFRMAFGRSAFDQSMYRLSRASDQTTHSKIENIRKEHNKRGPHINLIDASATYARNETQKHIFHKRSTRFELDYTRSLAWREFLDRMVAQITGKKIYLQANRKLS